jgi:VanZ family protein
MMKIYLSRWLPALALMLVIFWFSAQPASELPTFDWAESAVKKGGHMIGYGLLAFAYWRALDFKAETRWFAWALAVLYAVIDEIHQAFVPGRNPSIWDVVVFDNLGALIALWLVQYFRRAKRPARFVRSLNRQNMKSH